MILAVFMVTPTIVICLCKRAKRKKDDQIESNGCRRLEVSADASPHVYCTPSIDKVGHDGVSSATTDQQMIMQGNPAYTSKASTIIVAAER